MIIIIVIIIIIIITIIIIIINALHNKITQWETGYNNSYYYIKKIKNK